MIHVLNVQSRLLVSLSGQVRMLSGLLLTTIIMLKADEPAASALAEQEHFKSALIELRNKDENSMSDSAPLPAPHLQIFHSFVEALAKVPDIGGSARSVIESWLLEIEEDDSTAPAKIQDQCQSFQCFNIQATTDKVRLQIAMTTGDPPLRHFKCGP